MLINAFVDICRVRCASAFCGCLYIWVGYSNERQRRSAPANKNFTCLLRRLGRLQRLRSGSLYIGIHRTCSSNDALRHIDRAPAGGCRAWEGGACLSARCGMVMRVTNTLLTRVYNILMSHCLVRAVGLSQTLKTLHYGFLQSTLTIHSYAFPHPVYEYRIWGPELAIFYAQ